MDELTVFHERRIATKTELQSLVGKLSFAMKCVPAGRFFLRRFLNLATLLRHGHHKIRLNLDFEADIEWRQRFLPRWNGTCSFLQSDETSATSMHLFTDAAGRQAVAECMLTSGSFFLGLIGCLKLSCQLRSTSLACLGCKLA